MKRVPQSIAALSVTLGILVPVAAFAVSWADLCRAGAARCEIDLVIAGGEDADDAHTLYQPVDVAVLALGDVLVLDRKLSCVKRFSADGAYVGEFGRDGAGPGELRGAGHMTVTPNGRVVIYEFGNRRFSVFDAGGEHLESIGWFEGMRMCWTLASGSDGKLWAQISEPDADYMSGVYTTHLVRLDSEFQVVQAIDSMRTRMMYTVAWEGGMTSYSAPFYETLEWCVLADGHVAVAHSGTYHIRVLSVEGATAVIHFGNGAGPPVTDEDKDDYFASFVRADSPGMADAVRRSVEFPKRKPVLGGLWADPAGYLIVEVTQPLGQTPVYDVFEPSGDHLGAVAIEKLPRRPIFAADGFVYGVRVSEEDLPKVCRYRITPLQ